MRSTQEERFDILAGFLTMGFGFVATSYAWITILNPKKHEGIAVFTSMISSFAINVGCSLLMRRVADAWVGDPQTRWIGAIPLLGVIVGCFFSVVQVVLLMEFRK